MRLWLALFLFPSFLSATDPDRVAVLAAMEKAASAYHSQLSVNGGYASQWDQVTGVGFTEHKEGASLISIQPHGTTTIGLAALHAFTITGSEIFRKQAAEAAHALTLTQLSSGGWPSDFDFDPKYAAKYHLRSDDKAGDKVPGKRRTFSSLDDNKTQSALLLLLEYNDTNGTNPSPQVQDALQFGLRTLLSIQAPNGGFPQQFSENTVWSVKPDLQASLPRESPGDWPNEPYKHFLTLNDNNLYHITKLLLRAAELEQENVYLEAPKDCGQFLLLAQLPAPQPGWAQQYNQSMQPAWARKFEPPAVASVETLGAVETLFELWISTGEEAYKNAITPALDWLDASRLPNEKWARFYELRSNTPLYFDANDYSVTYSDENLPGHYGFQIEESFGRKIERMRRNLTRSRASVLRSRQREKTFEEWRNEVRSLKPKV